MCHACNTFAWWLVQRNMHFFRWSRQNGSSCYSISIATPPLICHITIIIHKHLFRRLLCSLILTHPKLSTHTCCFCFLPLAFRNSLMALFLILFKGVAVIKKVVCVDLSTPIRTPSLTLTYFCACFRGCMNFIRLPFLLV